MALSSDLISQFVKATKDEEPVKSETTVYGTVEQVNYDGRTWVRLDGSDSLTPVSTTADVQDGERVTVLIKNHTATITGNVSSPAARTDTVKELGSQISEVEILVADKVSTEQLAAEVAAIDTLLAGKATIAQLQTQRAEIDELLAEKATVKQLEVTDAKIDDLDVKKADVSLLEADYALIKDLEATNAELHNLSSTYGDFESLTTENFKAVDADIKNLDAEKLDAESARVTYANIDFSNIGEAAVKHLFADYGLIKDIIVQNGTISGELVGVTIKGDLIEGNTVKADKLVVKGEDGLYYKLNFEAGAFTDAEEVPTDSLHGSVITAKSITADKVTVSDLVAFGATIGGFHITNNSIYSGVKQSANNTTRGIYLDNEGQVAFGDASNFLKYYKDANGNYKLEISASSVRFSVSNKSVEEAINTAQSTANTAKSTADSAQAIANTAVQDAANAQSTADNAASTADNAASIANTAKTTADTAKTTANNAASTASTAKTMADNAATTANTAKDTADVAASTANTAKSTADSAASAANTAKNTANTAQTTANAAKTTADSATNVANTAQATANTAVQDAANAQATADNAVMAVENIEVGGRNLLPKSKYSAEITSIDVDSKSGFGFICPGLQTDVVVLGMVDNLSLKTNTDYTLSFVAWLDTTDASKRQTITWDLWPDNLPQEFIYSGLSNVPTKFSWTISSDQAEMTDCKLRFIIFEIDDQGYTAQYPIYITDIKLESGNKPTDWTPAPEDVDDNISGLGEDIREELTTQRAEILQTSEGIFMSALEDYVETSEYDTFKQNSESQMSIMSDEISMNFQTTTSQIAEVDGELQTRFQEFDKHISFGTNGITITSGENDISLELDNTAGIVFRKNGVAFGLWDGNDFYTGNIVVRLNERAQFGNFGFVPRSDGSLSFLKLTETTEFYIVLVDYILTMYNTLSTYEGTTLTIDGVDASFEDTTLILGG